MICPECGCKKTEVENSRHETDYIRRRRICAGCGYRFTTIEIDADMWESMKKATKVIEERIQSNEQMRDLSRQFPKL